MSNKSYYIFGSSASEYFQEHDCAEINNAEMAAHISENFNYAVFMYDSEFNHPDDLLYEYDGWNGYAIIDEVLYNELLKKIDSRLWQKYSKTH
jgi:hypothetical protein